jgi:hypothetical protein
MSGIRSRPAFTLPAVRGAGTRPPTDTAERTAVDKPTIPAASSIPIVFFMFMSHCYAVLYKIITFKFA